MPDLVGALAQLDPLQLMFAGAVEQTQLHFVGTTRENREVDPLAIPGGAARIGLPGPNGRDGQVFCRL